MSDWSLFSRKRKNTADEWNLRTSFGENLSFSVAEAYKLLRTNITFSFPDEGIGHVIGIASAVQSEGKSSTACNTAYALAEAGHRVLLLEGDLRRPTIAAKLNIERVPGLTNLLVSKMDYHTAIQQCALAPNMDILTSGAIPPNPSELLSSARMEQLIENLRREYDYVVVDLPPIAVVSDALVISKVLDGIVMIVRSGVSDQQLFAEAMRQLELVNVRILGFVYRDTDGQDKQYNRRYSKKYYKYYSNYHKDRVRKK